MSRLEQIKAMLQSEPDDVFLNFGLAMELAKGASYDQALAAFDRVLALNANYSPGYFQKARTLAQLGRVQEAAQTLQDGIEAARRAADPHAEAEMSEMLATIQ